MSQPEGNICYTYEGALEKAIEMEGEGFRHYLRALRIVKNKGAKEILKEAAMDELGHRVILEKALLEGYLDTSGNMGRPVPTMNLGSFLVKKELRSDSDAREALAFAIHLEKEAVEFYKCLAEGCAGAPMGNVLQRLMEDESRHLQSLEDLYEEHFMTEN
jgi:rubrerythrin